MLFFSIIRRRVAEAVLGGFEDAAAAVGIEDAEPASADVAALRQRFAAALTPQAALPAAKPEPEQPATPRRRTREA